MTADLLNGEPPITPAPTPPVDPNPGLLTLAEADAKAAAARRDGEAKGREAAKREADEARAADEAKRTSERNKQDGKWQEELQKAERDRDAAIAERDRLQVKVDQYETWLTEDFTAELDKTPAHLRVFAPKDGADGIAKRTFITNAREAEKVRLAEEQPATPPAPRPNRPAAARTPTPTGSNRDASRDQQELDDMRRAYAGNSW